MNIKTRNYNLNACYGQGIGMDEVDYLSRYLSTCYNMYILSEKVYFKCKNADFYAQVCI